jgi:hypothetical protein
MKHLHLSKDLILLNGLITLQASLLTVNARLKRSDVEEGKQMKVFKSNKTWLTATLQKVGTMFLVTIGKIKKLFDNEQTATNYITSLGYQF